MTILDAPKPKVTLNNDERNYISMYRRIGFNILRHIVALLAATPTTDWFQTPTTYVR